MRIKDSLEGAKMVRFKAECGIQVMLVFVFVSFEEKWRR